MPTKGSTPYGAINAYLADYTTNASGHKMIICIQCHLNKNKPPNAPYVVYNSPTYMKSIITTNLLHVQMLSFLDIAMHIQSKDWGFSVGKIVDTNLLSNHLFGCDTTSYSSQSIEHLTSSLTPLLSQNLTTNPFFQTHVTVFEQPQNSTSMCVLTQDVIQKIIGNATLQSISFSHMNVPQEVYDLALLFDMRTHEGPKKHANFYCIRNVHIRNRIGSDKRREAIAFRNNTLNANIGGMTLESALFPFLFLHGNGAYDGRTTLSEYLKYRMSTLFSPFTLYKPYLLSMYDIR